MKEFFARAAFVQYLVRSRAGCATEARAVARVADAMATTSAVAGGVCARAIQFCEGVAPSVRMKRDTDVKSSRKSSRFSGAISSLVR